MASAKHTHTFSYSWNKQSERNRWQEQERVICHSHRPRDCSATSRKNVCFPTGWWVAAGWCKVKLLIKSCRVSPLDCFGCYQIAAVTCSLHKRCQVGRFWCSSLSATSFTRWPSAPAVDMNIFLQWLEVDGDRWLVSRPQPSVSKPTWSLLTEGYLHLFVLSHFLTSFL